MLSKIRNFYTISSDAAPREFASEQEQQKHYKRLRMQSFVAATLGYSLYYTMCAVRASM